MALVGTWRLARLNQDFSDGLIFGDGVFSRKDYSMIFTTYAW